MAEEMKFTMTMEQKAIQGLIKECNNLQKKNEDLDARLQAMDKSLQSRLDGMKTSFQSRMEGTLQAELRKTNEAVTKKLNAVAQSVAQKANESAQSAQTKSSALERRQSQLEGQCYKIEKKYGFNTCVFLCCVLLFNIVATIIAFFTPSGWVFDESSTIWIWIATIFCTNLATLIIWGKCLEDSWVDYSWWEFLAECVSLVVTIAIISICFNVPIENMTFVSWILFAVVILASVSAIIFRIVYFSYEYGSSDLDPDDVSLWISIAITLCVVSSVVLMFLVF